MRKTSYCPWSDILQRNVRWKRHLPKLCLTNARHHFNGRFGGIFKEDRERRCFVRSMLSPPPLISLVVRRTNALLMNPRSRAPLDPRSGRQHPIPHRSERSPRSRVDCQARKPSECDSRNLCRVSRGRLACGVKSPRLFVTSDSFSENNKRICNSIGHVLAVRDFVSCGVDLVLAFSRFRLF